MLCLKIFDFKPLLTRQLQKAMKETSIIPCCNHKIRLLPWLSPRLPNRLGKATLPRLLPLGAFGASISKRR